MKNNQVFEALRALDKIEFREFGKFVNSPYHNNRSEVTRFYDAVKKFYPLFNHKDLTEIKLFSKIYPGKKYSVVLMRKVRSLVFNLFQKFITDIKLKENKLHYELELAEAAKNRKLLKLFKQKYTEYVNNLYTSKETVEVYEYIYKSENELRELYEDRHSQVENSRQSFDKIYSYFFSVILNEHLQIISVTKDYGKNVDMKLFNIIMNYLADSDYRKKPLINLYFLLLKLKTTGDSIYFQQLVSFRNKYSDKLVKVHNYNLLVILLDYCVSNINLGKTEFRKNMFELSQTLANEDLIDDTTEPITFTNIVRNSAILKHFDWAEIFINKYKDNLHPSAKELIVNYCKGMIEFENGDYAKSLKRLSSVSLKWIHMKHDIKKIILKCYYELGYYEELNLQLDSYRHFLNTDNQTDEEIKRKHKLFRTFLEKLNNCRTRETPDYSIELKVKIEQEVFFLHKEWLLGKLEELIKQKK